MADVCAVIATSHSPYLFATVDEWETARVRRAERGLIADTEPVDDAAERAGQAERCQAAFATLAERLQRAAPDVVVIFGDDQAEQFTPALQPALALFTGATFDGWKVGPYDGLPIPGVERGVRPRTDEHWASVAGHPALAEHLLAGLIEAGFDLAASAELPDPERGIGHAFMRPMTAIRPGFDLPVVPIFVNCFYPPQPTGRRCYELGRATARLISSFPEPLRVAVIGSGGLWHTPGVPGAVSSPAFDQAILGCVAAGDAAGMADVIDQYTAPDDREALRLQSGSGEVRNWIAAAAVVDGQSGEVIDHVTIHASPIGAAFAIWDKENTA